MKTLIAVTWVCVFVGAASFGWYIGGRLEAAEEQRTIAIVQRYCP